MNRLAILGCCTAASALITTSCNHPPHPPHDFTADVRKVCDCAGLKQTGVISVTTNPKDGYTVADFSVVFDGATMHYHAHFNDRRSLNDLLPEDYRQYVTNVYLDTLHDQKTRAMLIGRVTELSACLQLKLYGGPIIQEVGGAFVIIYSAVPDGVLKRWQAKSLPIPYIRFVVSAQGTIIGAYHGARPNQALERTAARRAFTFQMIKTVPLEAAPALVGGRSAYSR